MKPVTVAFALALTSCTRAAPPEPAPVSLPPATPAEHVSVARGRGTVAAAPRTVTKAGGSPAQSSVGAVVSVTVTRVVHAPVSERKCTSVAPTGKPSRGASPVAGCSAQALAGPATVTGVRTALHAAVTSGAQRGGASQSSEAHAARAAASASQRLIAAP